MIRNPENPQVRPILHVGEVEVMGEGTVKPLPIGKKKFVAWDGEGSMDSRDLPQDYVLFGNSEGDYIEGRRLKTRALIEFMLEQSVKYPASHYIHVGFAFDYDTNQILNTLGPEHYAQLAKDGYCYWGKYRIEHLSHKWLTISDRAKENRRRIQIMDSWGFFQASFVKAIKAYIPNHPLMVDLAKIEDGKAQRMHFSYDQIEYIRSYWQTEIQLLAALLEQLRVYMESVGLDLGSQWHGPGAVANTLLKRNGIKNHMSVAPDEVRRAAAHAYAGGRFELFRMGRHEGPVYGMDINSAYPHAIANLPSLTEGRWIKRFRPDPTNLDEFAVHYVHLRSPYEFMPDPGPLFHRDERGSITYPWKTSGWYWTPEVEHLNAVAPGFFEIEESWAYVGWTTRPFADWLPEMYYERQQMKARGDGAEKAIKLAINSLYGKQAQRAGWERNNRAPNWHQLEWAGYVTSSTRAQLYSVIQRIPWDKIIAVETDGIYTTDSPARLGISNSKALGGWEVTEYEEIMYVQSGVYFYGDSDGNKIGKYRGLDAGSLDFESMAAYLSSLKAGSKWESLSGPTTRFVGYRAANHQYRKDGEALKRNHRRWITTQRDISPGEIGKRRHVAQACQACRSGASALDMPHDLQVHSFAYKRGMVESQPHYIPWEEWGGKEPEWREMEISVGDLLV